MAKSLGFFWIKKKKRMLGSALCHSSKGVWGGRGRSMLGATSAMEDRKRDGCKSVRDCGKWGKK